MTSLRALLAYNMKERRRILGVTQARLAERVSTSTHYIGQIELENKFPTPEMLERIAAALEIDSSQLFSMDSFPSEVIRQFQQGFLSGIELAIADVISTTKSELGKMG
ncbi:MAG: helix-turn-helix domain-containing protein [Treponema sp.]|nr:helix-turn-helix domain-containing protein [Treponema sp.]